MDRLPNAFICIKKRYSGKGFGKKLVRSKDVKTKHIRKHGNYLLEEKQKTCTEIEM